VVLGIIGAVSSAVNLIKAFFLKTTGTGKSEPKPDPSKVKEMPSVLDKQIGKNSQIMLVTMGCQ